MTRLAAVAVIVALALAGCGSSGSSGSSGSASAGSSTTTTHFAKTKFVLHAGLAFGAFHRYIYKPLRAGEFSHPFSHKLAIIKAGLAALFIKHELSLALADARSSPTLSKLVAPITALQARISALRHGTPGASAVNQDNGSVSSIESGASAAGQPVTEQAPAHV